MECLHWRVYNENSGCSIPRIKHVQTEVPPSLLEKWLELWTKQNGIPGKLRVELRPHTAGSDLLELSILDESKTKMANLIFAPIQDRREKYILSIRDQNTFNEAFRKKRLMTLIHLFLIHRYKIVSVHYVTPTDDNQRQTEKMKELGIYDEVHTEVGQIIVTGVNTKHVKELLNSDRVALEKLISRSSTTKEKG
jgi:isocitrate lyase